VCCLAECRTSFTTPPIYLSPVASRQSENYVAGGAPNNIRKLREKTGVKTPYVEQVISVGGTDRDPRGWSVNVLHMALIPYTATANFVASVSDTRWWPIDAALTTRLAFDHRHLLELARDRLRNKTAYTALPIQLITSPFTLAELQRAFEALIGAPLGKKHFVDV
jgi:8-oxo-dGTP diphosphatase